MSLTLEIRLILAGLLLAAAGWFAWDWHHRGVRIDALELQHQADVAALKPLREANAAFHQADLDRRARDQADLEARNRQAAASQAALSQAQTQAADAQAQAALWQSRYAARPATCSAALAALDTACPSLKDY